VLDFRASAAPAATTPGAPTTTPTASETAGTVTSFKENVLTITLTDKTQVSGLVTEKTEIHCTPTTPPAQDDDADDQAGSDGADESGPSNEDHSAHSARAHKASNGDSGQQSCTTAALVPGALVREAELSISSAGAVWDHVDLFQ
jgi:hypothetical protein